MKRMLGSLGSVLVVLQALAMPLAAMAAPAPSPADAHPLILETSPLPIALVADPGTSVSTDIRVKQAGPDDAKLQVTLQKFGAYGDQGKPQIDDFAPGDDYKNWVHFDKPVFDAPANVWQTEHVTINLPKDAAFGYYYAVIFSRVGDTVHRSSANSVAGATAVLVLLEARNPNANRTMQLASFSSQHRIYEFLPANLSVNLRNIGNVHGVPHGDVFLLSGKKQLAVVPINAGGGNVLPQSNRVFPVKWSDGYPAYQDVVADGKVKIDSKGNQVEALSWDPQGHNPFSKIRIGKYTAQLVATYDNGHYDVPIEASLTFWVIPWRILIGLLLVVVLVGLGVYWMVRGTLRGSARGLKALRRRR